MSRCARCGSPDGARGCSNADCSRWTGPEEEGLTMNAKKPGSLSTQVENRGTAETPFGYVYVGSTRVGYSKTGADGEVEVWFARGWPEPTRRELTAAVAALRDAGHL